MVQHHCIQELQLNAPQAGVWGVKIGVYKVH